MAKKESPKKSPQSPSPPPPQKAEGAAEASSPASSRASKSESAVADPGPEFDPADRPAVEPPPPAELPPGQVLPEWDEQAIADLLGIKGRALHAVAGAAEQDWIYTELDLAAIAPPLTRICNRYDPVRQYAAYGDPLTVMIGMAGYITRSALERKAALEVQAETATEQPIPPAPDPGPVPPPAGAAPPPPPPQQQQQQQQPPGPPPPPPPSGEAINAAEVSWERQGG